MIDLDILLNRGVDTIYPSREALAAALQSGKKLTLYLGMDPTGALLHIGHTIPLRKLAHFQKAGHKVILLVGDFTARIGDPTGKDKTRVPLTPEQVVENAKTYRAQAAKILDFDDPVNPIELRYNSTWLAKLNFADVVKLASEFTVQQMLERDMFQRRHHGQIICPNPTCRNKFVSPLIRSTRKEDMGVEGVMSFQGDERTEGRSGHNFPAFIVEEICPKCNKKIGNYISKPSKESSPAEMKNWMDFTRNNIIKPSPISLHEFFYPLMQGYDSVAMDVDLEVGGTDQTFNMLAGRTLQKSINHKEKFVVTVPLLADSNGVKVGKSEGNVIAITAEPADLYGKIMALGDDVILQCFELCTDVPMVDIKAMEKELKAGANPRDYKMRLAREIVTLYNDAAAATFAESEFHKIFADKGRPEHIPTQPQPATTELLSIVVELGLEANKSGAKRLVEQGGLKVNDVKITDWKTPLQLKPGDVVQAGKRKFVQIS